MSRTMWKPVSWFVAGAAALLLARGEGRAQAPLSDLEELRARLERLEKQNEQLLRALQQRQDNGAPLATLGGPIAADGEGAAFVTTQQQPSAPGPEGEMGLNVNKGAVEKIVGQYLKSKDEEKKKKDEETKKEEEKKKKEAEDAGHVVGKDLNMKVVWRHGLWAETADKAFKVHVGGRTQFDTIWMDAPPDVEFGPGGVGDVRDAYNFRRARLAVDGTFWEVIDFNCEYDFLNTFDYEPTNPPRENDIANTPVPTDLWAQITHIPGIGVVRVGNQKPAISFEHLTSSRYLNFLERSFAFDAFIGGLDNGFKPGVAVLNRTEDERATWQLGVYKNNQQIFGWNTGESEYDVTGRVTWLPYYEHDGRCLVHLGLGASHRDLDEGRYRYRARTLLRNGPGPLHTRLVDVTLDGDDHSLVVPEFAAVFGPWTLQAEYFAVWHHDTLLPAGGGRLANRGTTYFQSAYAEVLYFLTGEHRPYNKFGGSGAAFTRVIPHRNYYLVPGEDETPLCCPGAWQVGARYSWIDLNDRFVNGGVAHDVTLGLNWFLNPNMKFQWNYSIGFREVAVATSDGPVHGLGMRMAFDF